MILCALFLSVSTPQVSVGWTDIYNGPPGNQNDSGEFAAVDGAGNLVVSGFSLGITGGLNTADIYTRKMSSTGNLIWEARWDGGAQDITAAMTLDALGNVYVAGERGSFGNDPDFVVIKYSPLGFEQWSLVWDAPSGGRDVPAAIGVDAQGFVYVCGETQGGSYRLCSLLRISPDGILDWERHYAGPWLGDDLPTDMVVTDQGGCYLSLISSGQTTRTDFTVLAYDQNGTLLWENRYDDNGNWDRAWGIELSPTKEIVVAGSTGAAGLVTVRRFSQSGALLSHGVWPGTGTSSAWVEGLLVAQSGHALVYGSIHDPSWDPGDFLAVRFDPAGGVDWARAIGGPGDADDGAIGATLDSMDNLYLVGLAQENPSSWDDDGFVVKLGRDGVPRWTQSYDGGFGSDVFFAAATAPTGEVYVSGYTDRNSTGLDWVVRQYIQEAPPTLSVSNLRRGQNALLQAEGLRPGEKAWFLHSVQGIGSGLCPDQLGGLCLDLLSPVAVTGGAIADGSGVASFLAPVPAGAPLRTVGFQVVAIRGGAGVDSVKSAAVAETVKP